MQLVIFVVLQCNLACCGYIDSGICAERAMSSHRNDGGNVMRDALIALLVAPTVADNRVVRAVFGEATMQPVLNI